MPLTAIIDAALFAIMTNRGQANTSHTRDRVTSAGTNI